MMVADRSSTSNSTSAARPGFASEKCARVPSPHSRSHSSAHLQDSGSNDSTADADVASLRAQVTRLSADLSRLQSQLEFEKRLRTDRLRRASERVMLLMASTSLEEGKVEVLKQQLMAERELRDKLEEELDALRASIGAGRSCGDGNTNDEGGIAGPASNGTDDMQVRQSVFQLTVRKQGLTKVAASLLFSSLLP